MQLKYEKCSKTTCRALELGLLQTLLEPCDDKMIIVTCARSDHDTSNQIVLIEFQWRSRSASGSAKPAQKFSVHMKNHFLQSYMWKAHRRLDVQTDRSLCATFVSSFLLLSCRTAFILWTNSCRLFSNHKVLLFPGYCFTKDKRI